MSRRNENWLLVEWSGGEKDVVHVKSVLNPIIKDLKVGEVITLSRRGEPQTATLISRSRDREELNRKIAQEVAGLSPRPDDEAEPFSASEGSSWEPSDDDNDSADSDNESTKRIKLDQHYLRQYINRQSSKKVLIPSHRANAVVPKVMRDAFSKKNDVTHKRAHNGTSQNASFNKSLPDSTKRINTSEVSTQTVKIDVRELAEICNSFRVLFKMIEDLKRPPTLSSLPKIPDPLQSIEVQRSLQQNTIETFENVSQVNETVIHAVEDCEENVEYENEEFNRSDDNVLITNKYDNLTNAPINKLVKTNDETNQGTNAGQSEWIPIGSGKTLIHVDQFRKVNWKSYTVATRTLLLAVFPRRILATHSLTGKPSPAFLNKPAKMCLDPKIVSDVIIEIMDRFDVKENLVRGIITTKCADECKMLKQRVKRKKLNQTCQSRSSSNQENESLAKGNLEKSNHVAT